ncbi:NAD(P)/FAD-dependent oxidoreductase [Ferrimonas balearica]|uniref:NAD(P)/FAD-dependent oxidoreductase n=1 Tax=Ferrimonas balearica TaxID=44012 RepID=UPI001C56F977|nr:NAD(P)/FAD-dependent oxidoreductase [Ferrimonas balearica]MBW3164021.1 tryptophan 7-halogenase [Ferrimonas balearica]MBY6224003.1 tryptophan 7-halogenase [Ferrimonas balearica]
MSVREKRTVVVVGAGPSGALVSALLQARGHDVLVVEKAHFPRFSIGESLLPHCMSFLAEAGMDAAVNGAGFQFKNGAAFCRGELQAEFDFTDKFTAGPGTTFQVQRGPFDKLLADEAAAQGVEIRYGHEVQSLTLLEQGAQMMVVSDQGERYQLDCDFVLDASGFGRVLPRLLELERPSDFPCRQAIFTHIADGIEPDSSDFDRDKILITVHPQYQDVWFWLIPFSDGRASLGVVAESTRFADGPEDLTEALKAWVQDTPSLANVLSRARFDTPVNTLRGYSADVTTLGDHRFALLGNAGEFLDPVFSSGVTIALKSASLAAAALDRQLRGDTVDWLADYAVPLQRGVKAFKTYVSAWYDGRFQQVVFHPNPTSSIKQMISAILAGYAWDESNPYVAESERRLNALVAVCEDH